MLLITRTRPEVANLLGLNVTAIELRTLQRGSRNLKNWQRRGILGQALRDSGDAGNQRREGQALPKGDHERRQRHKRGLHLDLTSLKERMSV